MCTRAYLRRIFIILSYALAYSPELAHLAKSIQSGLGQTPYFDIHLTIGKLYEEKDRDPHSMVKVLKQALGQNFK